VFTSRRVIPARGFRQVRPAPGWPATREGQPRGAGGCGEMGGELAIELLDASRAKTIAALPPTVSRGPGVWRSAARWPPGYRRLRCSIGRLAWSGDGNQPEASQAVEQDRGQCLAGPQPGGYQSHSQGKTHQAAPRMVLRSHTPGGVQQEVYGFLLVHYAIRTLMHQAALDVGIDPDRMSFTRTLRLARRQVTAQAAFPPHGWPGPCPGSWLRSSATCSHAGRAVTPRDQTQDVQLETQTRPAPRRAPAQPAAHRHDHHRRRHQTRPHQQKEAARLNEVSGIASSRRSRRAGQTAASASDLVTARPRAPYSCRSPNISMRMDWSRPPTRTGS